MSIEIYPATVRQGLSSQNKEMQDIVAGIDRLLASINAYTGESELIGEAYSSHKTYMTDGHIAFLRKYSSALQSKISADQRHISAIDTHLSSHSWFHTGQIEGEIETWTRQIQNIDYLIHGLPPNISSAALRNTRNNLVRLRDRSREKLERVHNYISATNGIYETTETEIAEANRLLMRLNLTVRCATTGTVTMPTMLQVDIALLIDKLFPGSMREMLPGLMGMSESQLAKFLEKLYLAGVPIFCMFGADPVNLSTGNFIYSKEDMVVPGRNPLEFKRFYNSICGIESVLGTNWTHSYNIRLYKGKKDNTETVHVMYGDGHLESYQYIGDDKYKSPSDSDNRLTKSFSGRWYLDTNNKETYWFDENGLLEKICDINRNETKFEHTDNLLTKVSNPCGSLMFEYNRRKHLIKVTDHTGRVVNLKYEKKRLIKVIHPTGSEYCYEYDTQGHLSKVINPLGMAAISNEYDKQGRMIRQSFADGGEYLLSYDNKITTATEQNGNVVKYEHDDKYRTVGTIYSDSEERFEYNEQGKRTEHTDRKGNVRKFEYDKRGNMTKATDPLGYETTIEYSRHDKPTKIVTPVGGVITNKYDDNGILLESINPLGHSLKLTNNKQNLVTATEQPDGSKTNITYDDKGNISTITDAMDGVTKYEYDELNRAVKTIDPMGNETSYEYNINGDISKATNADGKTQTYEYNALGKLIKLTDFIGGVTTYKYNAVGKLDETINPSGGITKLEYDLMWNVTRVTDPCGNILRYEYDNNQRVIRTIDQEGHATNYEHDLNGNVVAVINALGAKTEITYDALDRHSEISEPDGAVTKLEYDAIGNVTKVTDPQSGEIVRVYDKAGQPISVTDQMGNTTSYTYTSLGQIESITDAIGGVTKYGYYPGGKLKAVTRPGGESESYGYDKNGNIVKITDNADNTTSIVYNCLDRIVKTTNPLGHSKCFDYDAMGNITGITDENGNTTKYMYSPTGELVEVIDAMGHSTKYSYDKVGQMTKMEQYRVIDDTYADLKQIELQVTTWERNRRGDVIKKSTPLGGESTYKYDSLGDLVSRIDEDGLETLYEYNLASKLEKVAYADGKTIELSYNPLRQLTQVKDWLGTTNIELDSIGRANKITDHNDNVVQYTWDALGRRESITYPDDSRVDYSYNVSGRLEQIISETGATHYSYDSLGRLKERIMPGDIVTKYISNPFGKLESLTHKKNDEILDRFNYSYDPVGNITQIEKNRNGIDTDSGVFSYAYDSLGRLTEATNGQGSKQYHYDSLGNRIMSTQNGIETRHCFNAKNQLIRTTEGTDVKEYGYDRRGNLTSILENGTVTSNFTYSAANRMVEAITSKGKAEYEYNGFLKRVSTLESLQNNATDTPDPLNKVNYALDLTKPYNDLLAIGDQRFVWGGELLMSEGSDEFTYLNDHLGSPIRLMGDMQNETLAYDEFGVPTVEASGNLHNPFGFTGYQPDAVSEMQYAQARNYAPDLGRFAAEDTHWHTENMVFGDIPYNLQMSGLIPNQSGITQSKNLYSHGLNNPLINFDPDGKLAITLGTLLVVGGAMVVTAILADPNLHQALAEGVTAVAEGAQRIGRDISGLWDTTPSVGGGVSTGASAAYNPIVSVPVLDGLKNSALHNVREETQERRNSGPYSVYLVWDNSVGMITAESVWYVGLTKDTDRREREHRRDYVKFGPLLVGNSFEMTTVITGLTKEEARAREQALMMAFISIGYANRINAIAKGKWGDQRFAEEVHRMSTLVSNIPCTY